MTAAVSPPFRTVGEEWLASYAAGGLSVAKRLLIASQAALQPSLRDEIAAFEHVGGAMIETAEGDAMSSGFIESTLAALENMPPEERQDSQPATRANAKSEKLDAWAPSPLSEFLDQSGLQLHWRPAGPGIQRAPLFEDEHGERLYLLRARPGLKIPRHSHAGEEWTLILQGGYHVGEDGYVAGDLHQEDDACTHQLTIDDDGPCISFVADEGRLRFENPVLRLLQPLINI